jgi:hypothetical protein
MPSTPALAASSVLAAYLAKTAPAGREFIGDIFARWQADQRLGLTRKEVRTLLNCGSTSEREKERRGILKTWVDGTIVRVSAASAYRHALDLVAASHPIEGPAKKARTPAKPFRKGWGAPRTPQERGIRPRPRLR